MHLYVVSCKESCDFLYLNTNKKSLALVCLIHTCVVCLVVIVCLFAILTDTLADTHIFLPSPGTHSHKFMRLMLGFTQVMDCLP